VLSQHERDRGNPPEVMLANAISASTKTSPLVDDKSVEALAALIRRQR